SSRADASVMPLPTQLGPDISRVTLCGRDAPLFAAYPLQLNAQIPWECPQDGSVPLTVTVNGQTSVAEDVNLAPVSPGVFTVYFNQSEVNVTVAALLHSNYSLVQPLNQPRPGATGLINAPGDAPRT